MANPKEIDPMLTVSDVALLLSVHINTVRRWSNQGILRAYRVGSRGDRRFRREDIASLFARESQVAELKKGNPMKKESPARGQRVILCLLYLIMAGGEYMPRLTIYRGLEKLRRAR